MLKLQAEYEAEKEAKERLEKEEVKRMFGTDELTKKTVKKIKSSW